MDNNKRKWLFIIFFILVVAITLLDARGGFFREVYGTPEKINIYNESVEKVKTIDQNEGIFNEILILLDLRFLISWNHETTKGEPVPDPDRIKMNSMVLEMVHKNNETEETSYIPLTGEYNNTVFKESERGVRGYFLEPSRIKRKIEEEI